MKLNKLALAAAAVCGASSMPALALPASAYNPSTAVNIRLSGATAQDVGVLQSALNMCQAGTLHAYTASNQFVYFCSSGAGIGLTAGTPLAIYKHSVGGSGNGVVPVNNGTPLPFLDLAAIAASATTVCPTPVVATSPNGATYNLSACTTTTGLISTAVARLGISDVEPPFFSGAGDWSALSYEPLATVIFGLPVTRNVYEALQVAQGLASGTCAPVGNLTEACMPSLSTAQMTSLYTQAGQNWLDVAGITVNAADNTVYVARRADTSGTQKTYEAVIARTVNGNPAGKSCQFNVDAFVAGPEAIDNAAANTLCGGAAAELIVNNSGSGQVATCLNRHQDNGRGAVGTLTTETLTTAAGNFRFVKVNGLAPTRANVRSGAYTYYGDASLNRLLPLSTNEALFYTAFKANFAIPAVNQPFGAAGLDTLDVVTGAATGNPFQRIQADGSGLLNNCQQARRIF